MKNVTWKPRTNTGKTRFKRERKAGQSWIEARSEAWGKNGAEYVCTEKWVR
jgi:hypothetical protein